MKVSTILCDRCGKVIEKYPIKMKPEYVDRETQETIPEDAGDVPGTEKQWDKDYCLDCTKKIIAFMNGICINTDFDELLEKKEAKEKEEPKREPIKIDVNKEEPELFREKNFKKEKKDKPTIKELVLQGVPKKEVCAITECTSQSYDQTRYKLKKAGYELPDIKKSEEKNRPVKCSEVGAKCAFGYKAGGSNCCDYINIAGHSRGCPAEACTVYKNK